MEVSLISVAPIVAVAVVGIVYLALRLHGEAMKYVSEVQFYLNQKTIAFNRANAGLSVLKTKMAEIEKKSVQLERENLRLRKSLEVMNQTASVESKRVLSKEQDFIENSQDKVDFEKLEKEIVSIQNVLNRDLKTQLKNYSREVDWLSRRLSEVQNELGKKTEPLKDLSNLSYKDAA